MRRNLFIGLMFGTVLLLTVDVYGQEYVFGPNVRVSDYTPGTAYAYTPNGGQRGVAVRGDTVYCVWDDNRFAGDWTVWFSKSTDGGQTFLPNVQVDDGDGEAYTPTTAVGNDGTIYVAWDGIPPPFGVKQVFFSKSTDGGLTFTPDIVVNDTADNIKNHPHRNPSMAVDSSGIIYIAFDDARNDPLLRYDIFFSKSTDAGLSFLPDVMVNDSLPGNPSWRLYPGLAADNSGNVFVVWRDERDNSWNDIYFSKSTDGGLIFLPDVTASDTDSCNYRLRPSVNVDPRGFIHVMWYEYDTNANIFYSRSVDGGLTFSPQIMVNDSAHESAPQASPSMCVDDIGNVYAVWENGSAFEPDIFFTLSTDTSNSAFVEPNVLVDETDSSCFYPSIAVDDTQKAYVMWCDFRIGWPSNDVYLSVGRDESGIGKQQDRRHKTTDIRLTIHPNPFTSVVSVKCSGISDKQKVSLQIYDVSGRLIKDLSLSTNHSSLTTAVSWDGKDDNGKEVPSGIYFLRGKIGQRTVEEKLIKIAPLR